MDHAESADRVVAHLNELRALTSTERGAQRVAWGPVWRKARDWFKGKVAALGLPSWTDAAGNLWVKVQGERAESVILGSHLDSVPSGGWLDGCLGVVAGLEVLARWTEAGQRPPLTLYCVDWADEEGARFGRSLVGSAAAAGALDPQKELAHLVDRTGIKCPDAMMEDGVLLGEMMAAHAHFQALGGKAYLELHIEQGPVLEALKKPTAVVLGTMGVERYLLRFNGQAAHAGATPIPLRQDAFLAAAEFALACREIGLKSSGKTPKTRVVATCGVVKVEPNFVTAIPGAAEISIDLRALDGEVLGKMRKAALAAGEKAARRNKCAVEARPLLRIEPRPFDETLLALTRKAVKKAAGSAPEIPSGPLHDASEMAAVLPTVMIFAQSSPGLSHCKEEDTPLPALKTSIRAFLDLAEQAVALYAKR